MSKTLIIGYGNTLRSDDGIGVWIADRIDSLHPQNVDVRTCHQLHLELVPDLIEYDRVVLIDAGMSGEPIAVEHVIPRPLFLHLQIITSARKSFSSLPSNCTMS